MTFLNFKSNHLIKDVSKEISKENKLLSSQIPKEFKRFKYKNLTIMVFGIIFALVLSRMEVFHQVLLGLGEFEYVGAFFAGMLFVSTFTVATGALILLVLAENLPLFPMAVAAGAGGVFGDLVIFYFVRDKLSDEIKDLYNRFGGKHLTHILHTVYFRWTLPVVGAVIIASPLPDEIGVSLMGISKMNVYRFIGISFLLNTTGILVVLWLSQFVKP